MEHQFLPVFLESPGVGDGLGDVPFTTASGAALGFSERLNWPQVLRCDRRPPTLSERTYTVEEDFDGTREYEAMSLASAKRFVDDTCTNKHSVWASFVTEDLEFPNWWLGKRRPELLVPAYDKVILTAGDASGMGLHRDEDPASRDGAPIIATFLTITEGLKRVIMLPPDKSRFQHIFKEDFVFPEDLLGETAEAIRSVGGYCFDFSPDQNGSPLTLLIPRGWWHWLVSRTDSTVILTSSLYIKHEDQLDPQAAIVGIEETARMAEEGLKLFAAKESEIRFDMYAAEQHKVSVEEKIAGLKAEESALAGKENKKARSQKSKQIAALKTEAKYVDACRVLRGFPASHGNFVL